MKHAVWTLCLILCVGSAQADPSSTAKLQPKLTVRIFDFAGLPVQTLGGARTAASWIFRQAGIEVEWLDCSAAVRPAAAPGVCSGYISTGTATIRILPESTDLPAGKFGVAIRPGLVYVFVDRLQKVTEPTGFSFPLVLGHVIAHELGHLLLVDELHARTGIMNARLLTSQCSRPGVMRLTFTDSQAEQMETRLRAPDWRGAAPEVAVHRTGTGSEDPPSNTRVEALLREHSENTESR